MENISRRNFMHVAGAGLFSLSTLGIAGCSGSGNSADEWGAGSTLRVGSDCAYAPHSWIQSDDSNGALPLEDGSGYVGGYDTKIAQRIADAYDWNVVFVRVDWDGIINALNAGSFDCVIDGMGVTEERKQAVDFSDYYWSSDQGILLLKTSPYANATSLNDFAGAKVAAQLGTIWEPMVDQIPNIQKQDPMVDLNTVIAALQAGTIDATIMGETEAKSCMISNPDLTFITFPEGEGFQVDLSECSAGIAVKKGNTVLLDKINAVVDSITRDEQEEMMQEAFDEQPLSISEGDA